MDTKILYNGWFPDQETLYGGWWEVSGLVDITDTITHINVNKGGVVDWVSVVDPLPVTVTDLDFELSLVNESVYIDTRKGEWAVLASGGNDTFVIPTTMPGDSITISSNACTAKAIFSTSGQYCNVYIVAGSNGIPSLLDVITVSGIYLNDDGQYESDVFGFDTFGYDKIKIYKDGLSSGIVQIKGIEY
ncbi:MAG: hypothetical protein ACTSRA_12310 [Promethearchaeota archaeon]